MAQLLLLSPWLHVQTVQRALMLPQQEALCARCVQLVCILLLLLLWQWQTAAAVQQVPMALALAFLQRAIAQAVALAIFRVHWVLFQWLPAHSVGQEHTLPKGWNTAVVPQALQHVI